MTITLEVMMSRKIPLTRGYVAIVDDVDFEWLSQFKWKAHVDSHNVYAAREQRKHEVVKGKARKIFMHRQIMNPEPSQHIDHKNHNGLDNRKTNLRVCTQSQNYRNRRKGKPKSSQYKGVYWHKPKQRWRATIGSRPDKYYLGNFTDEVEAAKAYDKAAREMWGEFACLNFPD